VIPFPFFCSDLLTVEIGTREIDDFVTSPVEDRFHHEEAEAFCLLAATVFAVLSFP
jgi:hypothetical protein